MELIVKLFMGNLFIYIFLMALISLYWKYVTQKNYVSFY